MERNKNFYVSPSLKLGVKSRIFENIKMGAAESTDHVLQKKQQQYEHTRAHDVRAEQIRNDNLDRQEQIRKDNLDRQERERREAAKGKAEREMQMKIIDQKERQFKMMIIGAIAVLLLAYFYLTRQVEKVA